jgi:penicillin-insensitive murein endopeptidase
LATPAEAKDAVSYGSGRCGRLVGSAALPCRGTNFEVSSPAVCILGRNHVHPLVRQTVVEAYRALEATSSGRTWQYGDTGTANGGPLWPHRTHQNGLSVDFFMPMVDQRGPARLPTSTVNRAGYGLELTETGTIHALTADWAAVGQHLLALEAAGRAHSVVIKRIIVTPAFHQKLLEATPQLARLYPRFMQQEAWVRHDEHYHVDFGIPAELTKPLVCEK